jgi:hypothetical protein
MTESFPEPCLCRHLVDWSVRGSGRAVTDLGGGVGRDRPAR